MISNFHKSIITLITGTTIAQAIPIAITPILTRIYSPEDFGVFALYLSITSILAILVTGRYEMAIILPEKNSEALNLLALSLLIATFISSVLLIVVIIFNTELTALFENKAISQWLYFIPLSVLLTGFYQSFYFWNNRHSNYATMSKSRVVNACGVATGNVTIGTLANGAAGLVIGNIVGQILSVVFIVSKGFNLFNVNEYRNYVNRKEMKRQAIRYNKFPIYDSFASLFNVASHQSVHIFFNLFFGAMSAGFYFLTQKMLGLPIQLIATSVQSVFRESMTKIYNKKGDSRGFFISTLFKLFLLALFPCILLYIFAIDIFVFVFGEDWAVSGEYVKILLPVFFLRFLSFPMSAMFYIAEKQHYNIIGQFLLLVTLMASFYLWQDESAIFIAKTLSVVFSLFYLIYLILSYSFTRKT